ncbi:lytic polysaccharide monooxygenase, partial [Enterococcus faecalis]|uniref:lytic polysaccharide monooxygenase n=1 Tax=Enterococcus faecalis TaxID=1351 RepID=UPI003D10B649
MNIKSIKKVASTSAIALGLLGGVALFGGDNAFAHGYVESPASRGYVGSMAKQKLGWQAADEKYGAIINEPQSIEAPKGFPEQGPADGKIASGNGLFPKLDVQKGNYWDMQTMKGGVNYFTWHYTANHSTAKWHYYITKKGWNPDKPLTRDEFELIGTVQHDGSSSANNRTHAVNVPTDRSGYYVILAVWDVADTGNAFYNVIDVNLQNNGSDDKKDTEAPTIPTNLSVSQVTRDSLRLNWKASTDNVGVKEYRVLRNDKVVGTISGTSFEDKGLQEDTNYAYTVQAVDFAGNVSEKSQKLEVRTKKTPEKDTEAPTTPEGIHSMGETVSTIDVMWQKSVDNVEVSHYEIYRNGVKVGESATNRYMDKGLNPGTAYSYQIVAVDTSNNKSEKSDSVTLKTKEGEKPAPENQWKLGSFTNPVLYKAGQIVTYNGKTYVTLATHNNYGDPNWAPGIAHSL